MASPRILCQVCRVSWTSKPVWSMQPRKVSNNLHSAPSSPSAPPPWHSSSHIPPIRSLLHPPRSDSWWTPRWYSCHPSRGYSWPPHSCDLCPSVKLSTDLSPIKMTAIGYFFSRSVLGLGYEEAFCFSLPAASLLSTHTQWAVSQDSEQTCGVE